MQAIRGIGFYCIRQSLQLINKIDQNLLMYRLYALCETIFFATKTTLACFFLNNPLLSTQLFFTGSPSIAFSHSASRANVNIDCYMTKRLLTDSL